MGWVLVVLWVDIVQIAEIIVAASPAGSTRPAFHAIALLCLLGRDRASIALLALRVDLQKAVFPACFSLTRLIFAASLISSLLQAFTVRLRVLANPASSLFSDVKSEFFRKKLRR